MKDKINDKMLWVFGIGSFCVSFGTAASVSTLDKPQQWVIVIAGSIGSACMAVWGYYTKQPQKDTNEKDSSTN